MPLDQPEQATIDELARAMAAGETSAVELARHHLARIEALDGTFNALLEINPDALAIAAGADRERAERGPRTPLHGIPVLVKDNLDSGDAMATTAGSLALADTRAATDSTVVRRLREAGAVLLGKTNLSEWANYRSTRSTSGWSSRGGQTRNAYDPARSPGGSSSGSAVAVALGLCTGAIGTETDGSIVSPAAINGIVGIKPTLGLVSRAGIIPVAASQDTAGPMTRTVADGAIMLSVMAGADERDAATAGADRYRARLTGAPDRRALAGARLGVTRDHSGIHDRIDVAMDTAVDALRAAGATVVDPVNLPSTVGVRPSERLVLDTEFKHGLNAYLAARRPRPPIADLDALVAFNRAHAATVMPHFRQEILERAARSGGLDDPSYIAARETSLRIAAAEGIDATLARHRLDAIVSPTSGPAWLIDWIVGDHQLGNCAALPAIAGYPHVTVPMGFVEHLPVGISFFANAFADRRVIDLAHAFEYETGHRRAPAV